MIGGFGELPDNWIQNFWVPGSEIYIKLMRMFGDGEGLDNSCVLNPDILTITIKKL